MNNNVDVLKELEVKNKEIYLNKLNIDLDNNNDILLITIDNIINLFINEVKDKIIEVSNCNKNKEIGENVSDFYNLLRNELKNSLAIRENKLKDLIKNIDDVNYKDEINNEKLEVINNIKNKYNMLIDNFINKLNEIYDGSNERINDYLKILSYEKLINKLNELFNNMDIILYNSYVESNNKYHELNAKTLNK